MGFLPSIDAHKFGKKLMMKNLLLFLSFFISISLNAQAYDEIIYDNPNFFLMYENENILLTTNGQDAFFSGFLGFKSNTLGSVTIKPEEGKNIRIVPIATSSLKTLGAGTQIGGRPPLGGGGLQPKITLFPNPANQIIQLKSSENIVGYKIYDYQGTLKSQNQLLKSKQFSISLNNLSPGIYYTTIILDNGQTISKQFIKQ